ncbi:hypothetical protein PanWU01x14_343650, partial [Parasponia andersonii]
SLEANGGVSVHGTGGASLILFWASDSRWWCGSMTPRTSSEVRHFSVFLGKFSRES